MRKILPSIILFSLLASCNIKDNQSIIHNYPLRIPGEFEPQSAIWLGFRSVEEYGEFQQDTVTIKIIKALNPYIRLNLIIEHDSLFPEGKKHLADMMIDTSKIRPVFQSPTDTWFRDPGPVFGITRDYKLGIADFKYTNYMNVIPDSLPEWAKANESIDRDVGEKLEIEMITSIVAMEGGAFEPNGQGSLIQVENITLKRNPLLSRKEIEEDFLRNFGITNIIWLPTGLADDPFNFDRIHEDIFGFGTGGHTDEFIRFADERTILLAWVPEEEKDLHPVNRLNYNILSKNFEILKNSRNTRDRKFKIIKVPHVFPETYIEIIDSLWVTNPYYKNQMEKFGFELNDTITMVYSASYLNYIITNDVVILPQYWNENRPIKVRERDNEVREIFEKTFRDRKIIGIDPTYFNDKGGGMHCRYQSEPVVK